MLRIYTKVVNATEPLKHVALLGLRLLLAFIFIYPALEKWGNMEATIAWFGNEEWGLGMPFPTLNAYMAAITELLGVVLLTFGLFARFISAPLIVTMLVAIKTVHFGHGWYTIGQSNLSPAINERVGAAKGLLREHGNYDWLTEEGSFAILQNGWENPVTYIAMLLVILAFGPGKISFDYFLFERKINS